MPESGWSCPAVWRSLLLFVPVCAARALFGSHRTHVRSTVWQIRARSVKRSGGYRGCRNADAPGVEAGGLGGGGRGELGWVVRGWPYCAPTPARATSIQEADPQAAAAGDELFGNGSCRDDNPLSGSGVNSNDVVEGRDPERAERGRDRFSAGH